MKTQTQMRRQPLQVPYALLCCLACACGSTPLLDAYVAPDMGQGPADLVQHGQDLPDRLDLGTAAEKLDLAGLPDLSLAVDLAPPPDLATPVTLPPAQCDQPDAGTTGIRAVVLVDQYRGLVAGAGGEHEVIYGTVAEILWAFDATVIDTGNVVLALNVATANHPYGLPTEIPLVAGDLVQVQGEYVPASIANVQDRSGPAALIRGTYRPCGFVTIAGTTYQSVARGNAQRRPR